MIKGREAEHHWTPPGEDAPAAVLNRTVDDYDQIVFPHVELQADPAGLHDLGDPDPRNDVRVRATGEIPRSAFRRGKTITYTGVIRALSLPELREYQADLRAAFAAHIAEGRMDVRDRPCWEHASPDNNRYFNARALGLEMVDIPESSRIRKSTFSVAVRLSDPHYYQEVTYAEQVAAMEGLGLHWTLGAEDGLLDRSGNGRNGTAQGGLTVGGAASVLPSGESDGATDFPGSGGKYITSAYAAFVAGSVRTFCAWLSLDAASTLFAGSGDASHAPQLILDSTGDGDLAWVAKETDQHWDVAVTDPVFICLVHDDTTVRGTPYINGESLGDKTSQEYDTPGNFQFGFSAGDATLINAQAEQVSAFERALSDDEIRELYRAGTEGARLAFA